MNVALRRSIQLTPAGFANRFDALKTAKHVGSGEHRRVSCKRNSCIIDAQVLKKNRSKRMCFVALSTFGYHTQES